MERSYLPDWLLTEIPDREAVPPDRVVHNHVRPARRLGTRGFRAWLAVPDERLVEPCGCSWAPEVGEHDRVRRIKGTS
jgi:hypothetical protein